MSDLPEAPISTSSVLYYRGVAITITKRDPTVEIKTLIGQQLSLIDWMLDEKEALPSWNKQTNEEFKEPTKSEQTPIPVGEHTKCNKCGGPMKTSKAGNPYCKNTCWLKK